MNSWDFTFEESPWDIYARKLRESDTVSASYFLTLMEGEHEDAVEEAFQTLEDRKANLDVSDLPIPVYSGELGITLRREKELAKNGMDPSKLEENAPLRLYLEELASIPACGDVVLIAEELGASNREGNKKKNLSNTLVNLSLSRVVQMATEFTGRGVLLTDLMQEGSIGLWKCIENWMGTGADFERIRDWWIRFYMAKTVTLQARENGVGQKMRQALEDYRAVDERLLSELGRNPTLEEIALEMHISPEEAASVAKMLETVRSMHKTKAEAEPEEEAQEDDQAVEDTAYFRMRQRIAELLSGLGEQDQKLLTLRFGLEGGLPMSPEDTGKRLGLTPEEVVAREAAALMQLRNER